MVSVLKPRWLHPEMEWSQCMAAAGGQWLVEYWADRAEVVAEVRERGIRALEIRGDLSFVTELPDLEFIHALDPPDVAPLRALSRLRLLSLSGTWGGRIDASAWPALEAFSGGEMPKDGGGVQTLFDHPNIRHLGLGRPRLTDCRPISAPRLESLSLADSRTLTSLAGLERHSATLLSLTLSRLPGLMSLDGIEALERLEVLHLDSLRLVTTLDLVARLPGLRFLDISDLKGVETLSPLAAHPSLEYILFGRTLDLDLEPLFAVPHLKLISTGERYGWSRNVHDLPYLRDVGSDDPRRQEWGRLAVR